MSEPVPEARGARLREMTRDQILYYLREAADGDELIMKEVWEQCSNQAELKVAEDMLRSMIFVIEGLS